MESFGLKKDGIPPGTSVGMEWNDGEAKKSCKNRNNTFPFNMQSIVWQKVISHMGSGREQGYSSKWSWTEWECEIADEDQGDEYSPYFPRCNLQTHPRTISTNWDGEGGWNGIRKGFLSCDCRPLHGAIYYVGDGWYGDSCMSCQPGAISFSTRASVGRQTQGNPSVRGGC